MAAAVLRLNKRKGTEMLEVVDLSKKYGKVLAVDKVSFAVPDGKIGILLGPNGAGKSTVIKSIAGLLRYSGKIWVQGMDAWSVKAKKCFAYVPELPYMYESLTVREHIEFITKAYGAEVSEEEIRELFDRFELSDKQEKLGSELSKGMMQKVSICCALIIKPKVILLDEPMVGLDPAAIKELKSLILMLRDQGRTVLISTHMLEMVKELWDVTFVMDIGHILGTYTRESVENKDLEELFFSVTRQGDSVTGQGDSVTGQAGDENIKKPSDSVTGQVGDENIRKTGDSGESRDERRRQ